MGRRRKRRQNQQIQRKQAELPAPTTEPEAESLGGSTTTIFGAAYSGPLPPPAWMRGYDELQPGLADRIMAMAEQQASHRQDIEKKAVAAEISHERLGMVFSFTLTLLMLAGGIVLVALKHNIGGYGTLVSSIAVLIVSLFKRRGGERKEKDEKDED